MGQELKMVRVKLPRNNFVQVPSSEVPSSSCFTPLYYSINSSGVHCVGDSALGNLGWSLRDEEAPKSKHV